MKISWKAVLTALLVAGGATTMSGCASAQGYGYDNGYYGNSYYGDPNGYDYGYGDLPNGGIGFSYDSGGYCDAYGCPDDYWDLPVYYGPVYYGDSWFNGPVYYRDWFGRRQYWIRGGWHNDEWRGPRPSWWHQGRYGSALGLDFYRSHGFRGRFDNNRGFDNRRFDNRQFDNRRFDNRQFDNGRPSGDRQFRDRGNVPIPQGTPAETMRGIGNALDNRPNGGGDGRRFDNRNNDDRRDFGNRFDGNRGGDDRRFDNRTNNDRRNFDRQDFGNRDSGNRDAGRRDAGVQSRPAPQGGPAETMRGIGNALSNRSGRDRGNDDRR